MAPQKLKTGKYRVQVMVGGKMRGTVWTRKTDAEKQERELKKEQEFSRAGMESPQDNILFFDYAQTFMKKRKKTKPQGTWAQDEMNLRLHWLPEFSARPLMNITRPQVQEVLLRLLTEKKLSNATHNRVLQVLHKLFEEAIDDNKAVFNPASRIKRLSEKKKSRETLYWSDDRDIERYLATAYGEGSEYGLFGTIALFAGARVGEVIALKFKDIDHGTGQITIRRTLERESGKIQERTKGQGEGGEYILPLLARVEAAILQAKQRTRFTRPDDFVLQRADGSHMSYWTLQKAHVRICKKAEVPRITIHDMRRTFASMAETLGFARGEVQAMLGHGSITTTENYIRKNIGQIVEKAERLGFGALPRTVLKLTETK